MLFDLEGQGLQGWQIILVFLPEDFYKVFSISCFPVGLCVLVPLALVEQDRALGSAVTNIPLSGIAETASVVMDKVAVSWGFRFLPRAMSKQGGKALSCSHLAHEWSSTWERVKMSLLPVAMLQMGSW